MSEAELVTVEMAPEDEVVRLVREARAETARLHLELRELAHRVDIVDGSRSVALLEAGLVERLARREAERDAAVAAAEADAAARVEEAAEEARRRVAEAEQRVAAQAVSTQPALCTVPLSAAAPVPEDPPVEDPPVEDLRVEESPTVAAASTNDMAGLGEVIRRAIAEGLQDARIVPVGPVAAAATVATALPVDERPEPSFRERFLHLDVILPLVAAVIVFVVLLAWIA